MKTFKGSALILLAVLLAACGQQLVEFGNAAPGGSGPVAPTVVATDPAGGATGVVLNKVVGATFDTAMNPTTLNTTTFTVKAGTVAVAGTVSYVGLSATFTHAAAFASNTIYTAAISTGAKNVAGTPLASVHTWTFTTGTLLDTTPPTVISTTPLDLAIDVSVGKHPTATFSEPMDPTTVSALTFTLAQGTTPIPGTVSYAAAGTTATFVPASPLTAGLTYTATITTGARDSAGNAMVANHTWTFTTSACSLAPVALGTADPFVVLAGSTVTNTGIGTSLTGDLGLSPGTVVTGFPPGSITGTIHAGDPTAATAKVDLTTAYNDAAGRSLCRITVAAPNLGGQTLAPGLYWSGTSLEITSGTLTLDAGGDSSAVFIFQSASTLTTTSGLGIVLAGGARSTNVFWQVGSSATIGTGSAFFGTIMADQAITMNTGASLDGRALARIAAVTLDSNVIVKPAP